MLKNPPTNAGDIRDVGSIPGAGRSPGGGHGNLLQYSCLENPHGQRSLVGYSPWGQKESDMTKQLSIAQERTNHYVWNLFASCLKKKKTIYGICKKEIPTLDT